MRYFYIEYSIIGAKKTGHLTIKSKTHPSRSDLISIIKNRGFDENAILMSTIHEFKSKKDFRMWTMEIE